MGDILDLLRQDEIEKHAMGLVKRIEIGLADVDERLHAGQSRGCRSLHHMVADRQRTRRGDETE